MKINKVTRSECGLLTTDILAALEPVAKKYGMLLDRGNGKFGDMEFKLPIIFKVDNPAEADAKAEADYRMYADMYGCNPDWYGKVFAAGSKDMKVVGLNHKAPKNRLALVDHNGGKYKCPISYVERFLGKYNP